VKQLMELTLLKRRRRLVVAVLGRIATADGAPQAEALDPGICALLATTFFHSQQRKAFSNRYNSSNMRLVPR